MEELSMSDSIKLVILFAIVLLAGVGLIVVTEQYLGPKAVLTQAEKPPASIDILVLDNEVWIRPLDINGQSTKVPGNAQIQMARVTTGDGQYTPVLSNVVHIKDYELIYYNNKGNASNIFAATSEVNLPPEKGLYRIAVIFYPTGEDYSLYKAVYRGV
jgi:hypothetical protein